jgi:hypothetical protein
MAASKPLAGKQYFTVAEANARLPLVRSIIRDIMDLAQDLRERGDRLARVRDKEHGALGDAYREELQQAQDDFDREQERMEAYAEELRELGVELKDPFTGLVDFPCWMNGREVYLCWRAGEPEVGYWHELDTGFAGRQKIRVDTRKS